MKVKVAVVVDVGAAERKINGSNGVVKNIKA